MVAWSSKSIPVASMTGDVDWPCGKRMSLKDRYFKIGLAWNWGFFRRGAAGLEVDLLLELVDDDDVGAINVGEPRPPPPPAP